MGPLLCRCRAHRLSSHRGGGFCGGGGDVGTSGCGVSDGGGDHRGIVLGSGSRDGCGGNGSDGDSSEWSWS